MRQTLLSRRHFVRYPAKQRFAERDRRLPKQAPKAPGRPPCAGTATVTQLTSSQLSISNCPPLPSGTGARQFGCLHAASLTPRPGRPLAAFIPQTPVAAGQRCAPRIWR